MALLQPRPLLLDFGGVVLKTPFELKPHAEKVLGPLSWAGPFDPANDQQWTDYQQGRCTEREFWAERAASYGHTTASFMEQFYMPAGDHLVRNEMVDLIDQQHSANGLVGLLTNDLQAFHGPEWMNAISVLRRFDFIVDGSITGVLKPDKRAYQFAINEFSTFPDFGDASDIVFVDDQRVNFAGATELGIETIWFDPTNVADSIARTTAALYRSIER
jgi:putative hydrolase of the HAD superfamily